MSAPYNKVTLNGITLMDVSNDTVLPAKLVSGETAHKNDGSGITGNIPQRSFSAITLNGDTINVLDGYYPLPLSKTIDTSMIPYPTATKGTVSNHSVYVTPHISLDTGYYLSGSESGTPVKVSASELVSGSQTITQNGTVDVTNLASVSVNVSGGTSEAVTQKQVNFIDYDGTLLYSYTATEANALSALPANPTHTGLTAQGWNWSLAQIKSQLSSVPTGTIWVGQMYVTSSGDTEIDVEFVDDLRKTPILAMAVNGSVTIDWGDNSATSSVTGTSLTTSKRTAHTYPHAGAYTISIHVNSGSFQFYWANSYSTLLQKNTTLNENRIYANCVKRVRIGNNMASIGYGAFDFCSAMTSITIPSSITTLGTEAFYGCPSLVSITFPSGITTIGSNMFYASYGMKTISIPKSVTSIGNGAFYNCYSLISVTLPSGVTSIGSQAFYTNYSLQDLVLPDSVQTIGASAFYYCISLRSATIPSGVTSIPASAYDNCYSITRVDIPSSVTSIGERAFFNCHPIVSLTVPANVTSIGANAFSQCDGAAAFHIKPTTVPTAGSTIFASIASDCVIYVPSAKLNNYKTATNWSAYASKMQGE